MPPYVLDLHDIDRTKLPLVGGKAAGLGELMRIEGLHVPDGFCVTTEAWHRIAPAIAGPLDRLSRTGAEIRVISAEIRHALETVDLPDDVSAAILAHLGPHAYAVRSSATAEDLPAASFAGQQDSFLDVVGPEAILRHVRECWASLFTERAVTYRLRNGFDHRKVHMAVVVQRMVAPRAAGVLFTANPVSGNRKVACVEAVPGLGEGLVSGRVNPDRYEVRDGAIVARSTSAGAPLTEEEVLRLVELGRRIEGHFGRPQDIEWCLAEHTFQFVQSRPITTLFPIPAASDGENRVYLSVGHQQMMTDAMRPLGLSVWQLTTPRPMAEAGGRLFVDVTAALAAPTSLLDMAGRSDPLIRDALETILDRGFVRANADAGPGPLPPAMPAPIDPDPALVAELIARWQASLAAAKREIATKSGPELFDFILEDLQELRRLLFEPRSHQVFMTAIAATWWLNEQIQAWLGEKNAADVLTYSVPDNVTSEMGLALLDVADAIRPHPEVVAFLAGADHDGFLRDLPNLPGGREARDAIQSWLDAYGMRCVGEIDITRPRWAERPSTLLPLILGNVANFAPGAAKRRFEEGAAQAEARREELLTRLRALPEGEQKAEATARAIDRVRTFIGYREYPKYGMISRYFLYKQALLAEAGRLAQADVLHDAEDIFYLTFQELHAAARTGRVDHALLRERKEAFLSYQALTPPRVLTSEGEGLSGSFRREGLPAGALVGLAVSAGTVEGRARVILDMAQADVEPGDILVTVCTDPSWTPLFVAIKGLVTEVGGLMTHGAVIAREYGLPAVVGVDRATARIRDGQRIRVHGTEGYVEILG